MYAQIVATPTEAEERLAIGLYAVAARDFTDFFDMLYEPETTIGALEVLHEMLVTPNPKTSRDDAELNALVLPFVTRALERRRVA